MKYIFALLLLIPNISLANAEEYKEAGEKLIEATIIATGTDKVIEQVIKDHVPKELTIFLSRWSMIGKVLIEKRIEVTFSF